MTTATVLEFMHRTAADDTLRQQLEALLGVGDGNISSEAELDPAETAALTGDRAPDVAAFAAQNGFQFSADELIAVVSAFQQHQDGTLSDEEFARILGTSFTNSPDKVQSQVKRLAQFLSKTYLGIDLK
ncbi:hypothetical protein [Thermoleptolyngbya sp. M55_K2018_002]|uniref:hypothetical protein n=1 Tax=Thermoleptolyngbya sp. M55_K2018_002 TaxID=2747808 RepID=UPI0019E1C57E|nr:hypothetical protein [Thermoleptolyngbya sp. M55_K2018_002]HIK42344.1 hypothetical protein [Thermoleptolyngbya sp. M55_K2018_002]